MIFRTGMAAALIATLVTAGSGAHAAPEAELWDYWDAHDPASEVTLTHEAWDGFLSRHIRPGEDGVNRLAYGAVNAGDRAVLDGYIAELEAVPARSLSRPEQFAYWVNFYNALTVKVILDHYPVESIRDIDISPGFFADGPWGRKLANVDGEEVSLDDIEHRILRPIWGDPRIHYAVNCASIGCPNLQDRAMTADNAEQFLEAGALAFINHPRGARVEDGELHVSSIYDWFEEDFGGNDAGVIAHLKRYAKDDLAAGLKTVDGVAGDSYDWNLNDVTQ